MRSRLPLFVKVWFAVDLFLALFPPVHWAVSDAEPVAGVPMSLVYLGLTGLCIMLSVVVAYFCDDSLRAHAAGGR